MIKKISLFILLAAILLVAGVVPFSISGNTPTVEHFIIDNGVATPGFKMGSERLVFGIPEYTCAQERTFTGVVDFENSRSCWKVRVNGDRVPLNADLKRQGYSLRNTGARANIFCEFTECDFINDQQWKLSYELIIPKNSVQVNLHAPKTTTPDSPTGLTSATQTNLPRGTVGGFSVKVRERFLQQEKSFSVEGTLGEEIPFNHTFTRIGEHTITLQPFVTVYDYRQPLSSERSDLCSFDAKTQKTYCVQTTRVPIGDPIQQTIFVHPPSCESAKECGGTFDCISQKCVLNLEGNRSVIDVFVLYVKQFLSFLGVY